MFQKVNELPAAIVADMVVNGVLTENDRIVWKGKTPEDNIIFVATKDTLVDMISDTTQPDDIFEIWQDLEDEDLKN